MSGSCSLTRLHLRSSLTLSYLSLLLDSWVWLSRRHSSRYSIPNQHVLYCDAVKLHTVERPLRRFCILEACQLLHVDLLLELPFR
ncbi:hypothetical protein L227DRAFT_440443 [Lentinus tigrinus ALCF2SS1-6]|uniref:Uncharacterized protein n=1 Tax=Lentinus tigrinus ALCF2SS1-6 TaxID=1328759 RepID=A0A5C2RQD0_9APHY|nr:hypothetical protein L227DRAFT_440443 [Lentinus tigrinus ALCF2SS1-6]